MSHPTRQEFLGRLGPFEGDPAVLPFLPLIYVAWADGDLTSDEIRAISRKIVDRPWMAEPQREALREWLKPERPPSASALQALLTTIRLRARHLPETRRQSLVELGMELARNASGGLPSGQETIAAALADVEDALGMAPHDAATELIEGPAERGDRVNDPLEPVQDTAVDRSLRRILAGEHPEVREAVFARIGQPPFEYLYGVPTDEYRERVLEWTRLLAAEGFGALGFPEKYGGAGDLGKFISAFEALAFGDLSTLVKFGVQFGLFGGSVMMLGTEKHHAAYLPATGTLELPGCFAMTEAGHGSNVNGLETEARYDVGSRQFVVNTPSDSAHKIYIGNAACHARMATVFVQLHVEGVNHGVHAILVPIRNEDGSVCKGVRIEDGGEKMGLNGVDNGKIWFDHVRVPRENLLDRFAQVTEGGQYESPIVSPSKRFFTMLQSR